MKKFRINVAESPAALNRIYFTNHLPGLILLALVVILPNDSIIYPVVIIACIISIGFVFFPFYSNAVLMINDDNIIIRKGNTEIARIIPSQITRVRFKESSTGPRHVQCVITEEGGATATFYTSAYLFSSALKQSVLIRDQLLAHPALGERIFEWQHRDYV